jgi:hypothetical protein
VKREGEQGSRRQKAKGRRQKAEGSEKLRIAECGMSRLRIADCGMRLPAAPAAPGGIAECPDWGFRIAGCGVRNERRMRLSGLRP